MLRRRSHHEEKEVDLAALVDVLSNMLFFLLATVTFLQLKTLNAAVPMISNGESSSEKSVDVSVEIRAAGYRLKASGDAARKDASTIAIDKELPRTGGRLDVQALTRELWELKKKVGADAKNITIRPEQGILFDEIVHTMDAARDMPSATDAKKRVQLFPRPVLSELASGGDKPNEAP